MTRRKRLGSGALERRLLVAAALMAVALLYHGMGWQMPAPLEQLIENGLVRTTADSAPVSHTAHLQPYTGKVMGVHDGDTLTVLQTDEAGAANKHKIRMAEIDAPELKQPYGQTAKAALSALVIGKTVQVVPHENDRYGRTVAKVLVTDGSDTIDVNRALVANGDAWVYRDYLKDRSLLDVEAQAKTQKLGLWALQADQQEAPWAYRKKERDAR